DHYGPGLGRTVALRFEEIGEQEGKIDRLLRIESRIAERMVAIVELRLCDRSRTPGAFRNVFAGHFEMHAACVGTFGSMDREEILHFLDDEIKWPSLET